MEKEDLLQEEFSTYVVFRIKENLFSISGQYLDGISQLPSNLTDVPKANSFVRGVYHDRGTVYTVVDLRCIFDWETSQEAYHKFTTMIDARKQDHIHWVDVLKSCRATGQPFTLPRDHHQCNLGRWRDSYQCHVQSVNHLLEELDKPHEELHHMADAVLHDDAEGDKALKHLEAELVPQVLNILDKMKVEFQETEFREMLLTLRGKSKIAVTVDEVLSVELLEDVDVEGTLMVRPQVSFIKGIQRRPGQEDLIMELNVPLLMESIEATM